MSKDCKMAAILRECQKGGEILSLGLNSPWLPLNQSPFTGLDSELTSWRVSFKASERTNLTIRAASPPLAVEWPMIILGQRVAIAI